MISIDTLAADAVKSSQDMIYTVIFDQSGMTPLSTPFGSFSHENEDVRQLVAAEGGGDVMRALSAVRREKRPIEVNVHITHEGARVGSVLMGFSRDGMLPLNTHGGQLSHGRTHGMGLLHEAVTQLRGEAGDRQVADARVGVVSSGGLTPSGVILLRTEA